MQTDQSQFPNIVIMGTWAFWIDDNLDIDKRFLAAPYDPETETIDFQQRAPIDAFNISYIDCQTLLNALDHIYEVNS